MDSFYDLPRKAPTPTSIEKCLVAPVVPEVSMICTSKAAVTDCNTYNIWKNHRQISSQETIFTNVQNSKHSNGTHFPIHQSRFMSSQNSSMFMKKQVRFESPPLQQRPSLTYEPFSSRREANSEYVPISRNCNEQIEKKLSVGASNDFEKMYMANVPSRQLDLSIIDLPSLPKKKENSRENITEREPQSEQEISCHECDESVHSSIDIDDDKENNMPKTYKDFLELQKSTLRERHCPNDSVTDIFNYKKNRCPNELENKFLEGTTNIRILDQKLPSFDNANCYEKTSKSNSNQPLCLKLMDSERMQNIVDKTPKYTEQKQKYKAFDIQNTRHSDIFQSTNILNKKSDSETQTTTNSFDSQQPLPTSISKHSNDSEPTTKDLLKIIAQQNEQLILLQSQVAMLLNRDQNQKKPIEDAPLKDDYIGEKCVSSTQNEHFRQDNICTPRKRGMSKFSIDLMTSFEVAIRPQQKSNFINCEPKIQEITESENVSSNKVSEIDKNEKNMYQSLHLAEPVVVQEACPSPEPSININMNDYDSSDDEVSASEISATFYNNLMGQVNNILKKAQIQTRDDIVFTQEKRIGNVAKHNNKKINRVKEATLKHLQNLGVTIGPMDDSDSSASLEQDEKNYNPTEISFAVKQLLMKYLPDDQLARLSHQQEHTLPRNDREPAIMTARPEFSLASVQYMKKYNLIQSDDYRGKHLNRNQQQWPNVPRPQMENAKILDMTALKMQPKFL